MSEGLVASELPLRHGCPPTGQDPSMQTPDPMENPDPSQTLEEQKHVEAPKSIETLRAGILKKATRQIE